jgi:hypothetical protein
MGFDVKIITDCLALSKKQIRELLLTIILPIAAAVTFIAPLWPSLIKDARTLNICLLGFVVALPVVLINNVVWSLLFFASLERVIRIVVISFLLSSPGQKKNRRVRGRMRSFLDDMFDEVPFFDDMRSEAIRSFHFRDIASVLAAIEFYMTAIIICLFEPGPLISALLFLVIALLPPICAVVIIKKISSELQSTLSKMTHHEIMDQVGQCVVRHFSSDRVKQLQSFLYVFLDGDRNTSLSEILDSRMTIADSVLLAGETKRGPAHLQSRPLKDAEGQPLL